MLKNLPMDKSDTTTIDGCAAMTVKEFLRWAHISRDRFYKELRAERLHAKKSGGRTLILVEEAWRWVRGLPDLVLPSCAPSCKR